MSKTTVIYDETTCQRKLVGEGVKVLSSITYEALYGLGRGSEIPRILSGEVVEIVGTATPEQMDEIRQGSRIETSVGVAECSCGLGYICYDQCWIEKQRKGRTLNRNPASVKASEPYFADLEIDNGGAYSKISIKGRSSGLVEMQSTQCLKSLDVIGAGVIRKCPGWPMIGTEGTEIGEVRVVSSGDEMILDGHMVTVEQDGAALPVEAFEIENCNGKVIIHLDLTHYSWKSIAEIFRPAIAQDSGFGELFP